MLARIVTSAFIAAAIAPAQNIVASSQALAGGFANQQIYATAAKSPGALLVPQVVDGDGWKTTLRFVNLSSRPVTFNVLFFSDTGADMSLPIVNLGAAVNLTIALPVAGSTDVETEGAGQTLTQGWAAVLPQTPGDSIGGFTTFRQRVSGMPDHETTVPLAGSSGHHFAVMYDNTRFVTGVAVANASPAAAVTVPVNIRDEQGNILESTALALAPGAHTAFTLPALAPATAGRQGTIEFMADGLAIAAISLRFNETGFAPFPILTNFTWSPAAH